ncbi:protein kinase regulator [Moesziomyces antarcticus]|uniref:Protein kinase regulator n=2 Tax=Pseudozyma antarctica TaxID=84753 RepID=A0A081CKY2_PSEA2|nr:protein kinase regulator [Moesziomyces antarcticus]GAK67328.1 protein kinase regulator [Moesziomyces antarcticus]SPO48060.1 probable MAP kinase pathway-interacting protein [Moesziomyces antarcticus]
MTSHSPKSSPTLHINKWSEQQVADWLSTIGLAKYGRDFISNGITGDVLVLLDDEALKDIGVVTIGQRLAMLSAIYRLKTQFGIPIHDGDWLPKAVEAQEHASDTLSTAHMASALRQRDDRIRLLESQILRLADYLARFQQDMASVARQVGVKAHSIDTPITLVSNSLHSQHTSDSGVSGMSAYASNPDLGSTASSSLPLESPTSRNFTGLVSPTRSGFTYPAGHAMSGFKPATVTSARSDSIGANSPMTPTTTVHPHPPTSTGAPAGASDLSPTQSTPSATPTSLGSYSGFPQQGSQTHQQQLPSSAGAGSMVSPTRRLAHQHAISQSDAAGPSRPRAGSLGASNALSSAAASPFAPASTNGLSTNGAPVSSTDREDRKDAALADSNEPKPKATTSAGSSTAASAPVSASATSSSSDSNPYKSFRVTLDDPCYKVLPAALKKYKINDDWRKYALFICYGKTERCLSYDEKPLLLFQKLKENEQSPVFMLRHIRDVKSPIAIAEAKAASKLQERDGDAAANVKKRTAARTDRRRIIAGTPPPGALVGNTSNPVEVGPAAELPERNKTARTYAVAIYPYMPERDDEFDVNVGDTFIVINKAKGWWIVQRDAGGDGSGDVVYSVPVGEGGPTDDDSTTTYSNYRAEYASGWVPAGCLLETSRPLGSIVDAEVISSRSRSGPSTISNPSTPTVLTMGGDGTRMDAKRAAIPPALITSTSTPGVMLMDYQSAEGDLDLRKDERLRVFKRYNHWSYCVQERDGHARGWVPSWYIGKLSPSASASATSASGGRDALSKVGSNNALSPSATGNGSNMDLRAAQLNADRGIGSPSYDPSAGSAQDHASAAAPAIASS